jgi:hypothetical protein
MGEKLTLRLERSLIDRAKAYARVRGKSVSRLVADYFALLEPTTEPEEPPRLDALPPITRSLFGVLADGEVDEEDYRRYLEQKYG